MCIPSVRGTVFKGLKAWDSSDNSENWRIGLSPVLTPLPRAIREGILRGKRPEKMTLENLLLTLDGLCRVAPRMTSLEARWNNVAAVASLGQGL